ncbi:TetR/AcrR family transcriptional regulator [Crystallibacter degradans]|uniref:TetR/AcrR family transcriptional regulator n=1 Tax=Crystallibacter degradans TaxID=2726743 RepID=UPI001472D6D9|nr:TetR/AcrR family transcriptional regulator [Arthrobacter sp. SF27]NMR29717.1 TetR/AcrR family transcriptional regulator [Arthrobacter sp. SF27]
MTTAHLKTAKGTRTRDRMLESAVVLIPRLGWSAVTARVLAGHAGVRPGIIHYHFDSLEALLAEAAVGAVREALEFPSRQLESGISLDEGLHMFLAALDEFAPDEPVNLLFVETFLAAARGGVLRDELAQVLLDFRTRTARWLERVGFDGDADATAAVLAAAVDGLMLHRALDPGLTADVAFPVLRRALGITAATEGSSP